MAVWVDLVPFTGLRAGYFRGGLTTPTWSGDIWLSCWFLRTRQTSVTESYLSMSQAGGTNGMLIGTSSVGPGYGTVNYDYGYRVQSGTTRLDDSEWHHLCGVLHRSGNFRSVVLYEDGVRIGESAAQLTGSPSESSWDYIRIAGLRIGTPAQIAYQPDNAAMAECAIFHGVDEQNTNIPAQLAAGAPTLQVLFEAGGNLDAWYVPCWTTHDVASGPIFCHRGGVWTPYLGVHGGATFIDYRHPPVGDSMAWLTQNDLGFLPRGGAGGTLAGV